MEDNSGVNIFAYGTLSFLEVLRKVTGKEFRAEGAEVHGYARFRVRGESYPGMIPFPDRSTDGVLYFGVDAESVALLDCFEGDMYERTEITVQTEDGEWVDAETYIVRLRDRKRLSADEWDEYEFRKHHLAEFMRRYTGFERTEKRVGRSAG
jgi:gamma-glutamylcyclotransferase (GGCT)/AIG2-like uncharacterized protein YtfP